ncbi:patatin-like phospholipase family protein [Alkalitalea saponilacus]|uniref:Patatin-like phospholipase/acyl hydrolase n=1 Tax=Alkalitalea saponilacus TaxID=889453 RepID=A0A1T5B865_9BACT|nr:patatin-like phospholipase family protein [Alkalitalea saponilacus]ASB49761.1 patatin [Alkalitalea saponilacus]SKB43448.1 Patatin-like phospholipase/acyl hydrolase [Alkalitalea saponilacus]
MKKTTILSIDGGGIRGILPGVVIAYIEQQLQKREGEDVRLSDYFDLIAGTSTGGILSCLYLTPNEEGRPKFTASEAVSLYLENGSSIFNRPWYRKISNPAALFKAKYDVEALEKIVLSYLGDARLSQCVKPCLITAYDFFQRRSIFFNKKDTLKGEIFDYYLRDIARSTSAAPTYFKPSRIYSVFNAPLSLIDGGVFANNPAMCAYAEARTSDFSRLLDRSDKPAFPGVDDMLVISIGTGSKGEPYHFNKAKKWGVAGWLPPLIDILMSGNSETVDYQLKQLFATSKNEERGGYYRLAPSVGEACTKLDDASHKNMKLLEEAGRSFVAENREILNEIVDLLILNK